MLNMKKQIKMVEELKVTEETPERDWQQGRVGHTIRILDKGIEDNDEMYSRYCKEKKEQLENLELQTMRYKPIDEIDDDPIIKSFIDKLCI